MSYITTTQLRTKSSGLVETLKRGNSVSLIHRSKVIGKIQPMQEEKAITKKDIKELKKLAQELNLPRLSYKQREIRYRKFLLEKYGKSIS